jgi:hypothetical protein
LPPNFTPPNFALRTVSLPIYSLPAISMPNVSLLTRSPRTSRRSTFRRSKSRPLNVSPRNLSLPAVALLTASLPNVSVPHFTVSNFTTPVMPTLVIRDQQMPTTTGPGQTLLRLIHYWPRRWTGADQAVHTDQGRDAMVTEAVQAGERRATVTDSFTELKADPAESVGRVPHRLLQLPA